MARFFLLLSVILVWPTGVRAQSIAWDVCSAPTATAGAPAPRDCRPLRGWIDPQGREIWLRGTVTRPASPGPVALYVVGTAASEVWLNDRPLGANGRPAATRAAERPGRYEAAFPIPETAWRAGDDVVVIRMSAWRGPIRLDSPIVGLWVAPYPWPSRAGALAVVFTAAGALFAASAGFGLIHVLRRTRSSLILAALAATAGLQAVLESLRTLVPYAYPLHAWRLIGIWGLTAVFALLLVSWSLTRFWPGGRRLIVPLTLAALAASWLAPGFDAKTVVALMAGLALAALAAGMGAARRAQGARLTLAWLGLAIATGLMFPTWLVDVSYFLFAAGLLLPLLMIELVRLAKEDRGREAALSRAAAQPDHLTVASSRGVHRAPLSEIVAVRGADDYVELLLADGRRLLHTARLHRLEAELPAAFLRVHRTALANLDHVAAYERDGERGRLVMHGGAVLPVSRKRAAAVRAALSGDVPDPASAPSGPAAARL